MTETKGTGAETVREQIWLCGDYLEGDIYPVFPKPGARRGKRYPTSEVQARLNQRNAERRVIRLVHANFSGEDMALTLTHQDRVGLEEGERRLSNFLRRLRRRFKKQGLALKYISSTEQGKRSGRVHHHLILSGGVSRDEIEALWGHGYANSRRLQFGADGVAGLVRYMVKDRISYRRWNQSRGLIQPVCEQRDDPMTGEELEELGELVEEGRGAERLEEAFPGFTLVEAEASHNEVNRGVYVRFFMRRKPPGLS